MNKHLAGSILLLTFVSLAVFGLYLTPVGHGGHMQHAAPCPFAPGSAAICAMPLAHASHWLSSFAAVIVGAILLAVYVSVETARFKLHGKRDPRFERFRQRLRIPLRPLLLQELYSQGILNRKEPYMRVAY